MTHDYDGELSTGAKRVLATMFPQISLWRQRMQSPAPQPETGSSLMKDDQATHPFQVSHAAHAALVSAADHLDALRTLLQDARIVHARAPFTLLRAALENSSTTVWLLAPASRNERVLRRLRLQWADCIAQANVDPVLAPDPGQARAECRAKLQAIARARGLTAEEVATVASRPVGFRTIVETAADEARNGTTGRHALYCWMAASGIAHAQQWAILRSGTLRHAEVPGALDGNVNLALSASQEALSAVAAATAMMTAEGWRLLDEQCRSSCR